jgi:hypothetical protein
MALDADEVWELILKTIKNTLVYVIAMCIIGLNISVILGFGFFTYAVDKLNKEKSYTCIVCKGSTQTQPVNPSTGKPISCSGEQVNVSERFDIIFVTGFWIYILFWMCWLAKTIVTYCLAKQILFFKVSFNVILFVGFVQFVISTVWRFDNSGKVCSRPLDSSLNETENLPSEGGFLGWTTTFQWILLILFALLLIVYKL